MDRNEVIKFIKCLAEENNINVEIKEDVSESPHNWMTGSIFDIKEYEEYYYVASSGSVYNGVYNNHGFDDDIIKFGNVCKSKEYIGQRAKQIKLYNLLSNFAEVVNEGWKPDWYSHDEIKYTIRYEPITNSHQIGHYRKSYSPNAVYFKSEELAQRAIDEIIIPFERGEL